MAKFSGKGGQTYDEATFTEATIRAELVEVAHNFCLEHAAKVVDEILTEYNVTPKRTGIARHISPVAPSSRR
jgi:hypothetical protein